MKTIDYDEARELARLLAQDGEQEVAERISDAIESGTTATEILMSLRFHFRRALDERRTGTESTTVRIRHFLAALDSVLT
jgi:hypothetical protein